MATLPTTAFSNPTDYYNWSTSGVTPSQQKAYGESFGLTPYQLSNQYNTGGGFSSGGAGYVTPEQAASNLGASSPYEVLGNYWRTQDAYTGQYTPSFKPTDAQNYSGWTPGSDYVYSQDGTYGGVSAQATASPGLPDLFQPDLYSSSGSYGSSTGLNSSYSNAFSGLPEDVRNQLLTTILPQLAQSISGLNAVPGNTADAAARMYSNLSRQSLEQSLPDILNQLAGRGVLNSSVGSDAISNSANQIIPTFANAGYQSQIDAGNMQMQIPNILGTLLGLGNYSASNSGSTGVTSSMNTSESSNPLEPYQLLSNFLMGY